MTLSRFTGTVYWNTAYGVGARDTNFIFHYSPPCSPADFMTVLSFPRSFLSCRDYPRLPVSVDVFFSLDIFFLHVYINNVALFITTLCHDGSYTVLQEDILDLEGCQLYTAGNPS
jgi:hypothetical protein